MVLRQVGLTTALKTELTRMQRDLVASYHKRAALEQRLMATSVMHPRVRLQVHAQCMWLEMLQVLSSAAGVQYCYRCSVLLQVLSAVTGAQCGLYRTAVLQAREFKSNCRIDRTVHMELPFCKQDCSNRTAVLTGQFKSNCRIARIVWNFKLSFFENPYNTKKLNRVFNILRCSNFKTLSAYVDISQR